MKNRLILLFTVIIWLTSTLSTYPEDREPSEFKFHFEHITKKDGLSDNTIFDIIQDPKGFMWFATGNGLDKYDGHTITGYRHVQVSSVPWRLTYTHILYHNPVGEIWFRSGRDFMRFDSRTEVFSLFPLGKDSAVPPGLNRRIVKGFFEDGKGNYWIASAGMGLYKYNIQRKTFTNYLFNKEKSKDRLMLASDNISRLSKGPDGTIWFGTYRGGLLRFNPHKKTYTAYRRDPAKPGGLSYNTVTCILPASDGTIWCGTFNGLNHLDPSTGSITKYYLLSPTLSGLNKSKINAIYEDSLGVIWVGTQRNGLHRFHAAENRFTRFIHDPDNPHSLSHNAVMSIFESREGILWVGTYGGGINKLDRKKSKMRLIANRPGVSDRLPGLSDNDITSVYQDDSGTLWLGTRMGGLNRSDAKSGEVIVYKSQPGNPKGLKSNFITAILPGETGILWIGSTYGLYRFNAVSERFEGYFGVRADPSTLYSNYIGALLWEPGGKLWVGSVQGGLCLLDPKTDNFTRYLPKKGDPKRLSSFNVYTLLYDRQGTLWIGTGKGLNRFNPDDQSFVSYHHSPGNPDSLSSQYIYDLHEDRQGNLWIATCYGGLNLMNRESGTFTHYNTRDGLPSDVVNGILEDDNGYLWFSTDMGISRFDAQTGGFKNFGLRDGIQYLTYYMGVAFKNKQGLLFFGGSKGLNIIDPDNIKENTHIPVIAFSAFRILNQPVPIGDGSVLKQSIIYTDRVTLPYGKNIFSLEFAALDYTEPAKNQYQYKLEGLHDKWIHLKHKRDISFAGLKPGTYNLRVKGSNNDGYWNDRGTELEIIIKPPYWATWWFRGLVILIFVGMALLWHRNRMNRITLELKTESQLNRLFTKFGISEREQDVLRLALKGKSNKEIEDELFIAMPTVKKHLYNVYKKMGVKNRLELINFVQRSIPSNGKEGRRQIKAKVKI